jgi:hypothetical protein
MRMNSPLRSLKGKSYEKRNINSSIEFPSHCRSSITSDIHSQTQTLMEVMAQQQYSLQIHILELLWMD